MVGTVARGAKRPAATSGRASCSWVTHLANKGGICLDALNPAGRPDVGALAELGVDGVRVQARNESDFWDYALGVATAGLHLSIVLDTDAWPDDDLEHWAAVYAAGFPDGTVYAVANEMDANLLAEKSEASGIMSQEAYAEHWHRVVPAIRAVNPNLICIVGGLVSGQPSWAAELAPMLDPAPDGWDIHAYAKSPSEAGHLYRLYKEALGPGTNIYALEWWEGHHKIEEFIRAVRSSTVRWCRYCYGDGMWPEPPMGLLDAAGNPKPEYWGFQAGIGEDGAMAGIETREQDSAFMDTVGGRWEGGDYHGDIKDLGNGVRLVGYGHAVGIELDGELWVPPHYESLTHILEKLGFRLVPAR